jgi:hypothetical protein
MTMTDIVPPQSASVPPDRATTWFFSGQLQLPQTFCEFMDATNEILQQKMLLQVAVTEWTLRCLAVHNKLC